MMTANWIQNPKDLGTVCPLFCRNFSLNPQQVVKAVLRITAMGVYEAKLNGQRIGDFILAPGFTSYHKRHLYQTYDITDMLADENHLEVTVGNGWYCGYLAWSGNRHFYGEKPAVIAELEITYPDHVNKIVTDADWLTGESPVRMAEIYNGESYDARFIPHCTDHAVILDADRSCLVPDDGEFVREQERLSPIMIKKTPNGETIVDFGQNLTGYVEFTVDGKEGEVISYRHGEILDQQGNFYNTNLRTAKQEISYICRNGRQTYKPHFTFMGFRYLCFDKLPESIRFTAIAVHSDMKRTGYISCGSALVNRLFQNIIWGQKSNFLDIPTDCPQRDERLGWTGDAQVFIRTASYNYDVERFFEKWLADLRADQLENGAVPHVIPNILGEWESSVGSAAWGDAAIICPWQLYLTYGNRNILEKSYDSMKKWVEFSQNPNRYHFGDWLALDEPADAPKKDRNNMENLKGNSSRELISDAMNLYSTQILIKTAKILGKIEEAEEWTTVYQKRLADFRKTYTLHTQTEHVLALYFHLTEDPAKTAANLARLVRENGNRLQTGFVGTPYLLHALSENGYTELAYSLLLQEAYPSWLFSVKNGATTVWEHWDGVREDGSFTECRMNSYNHYAYGSVADWMYQTAAGIRVDEAEPGFSHIIIAPNPDRRLGQMTASIDSRYGLICSEWKYENGKIYYTVTVPRKAAICIAGNVKHVDAGTYHFEQLC
ncbi:MAG: family 78 glycoside hydrolase catalytic domain [Candidatus Merdivicinus sp.]